GAGAERVAGAGEDVGHLALFDRDQGAHVDGVLPAPVAELDAAAQHIRLEAGLAVECDDLSVLERALVRPEFLDNADLVVLRVPERQPRHDQQRQYGTADHDEDRVYHRSLLRMGLGPATRRASALRSNSA